MAIGRPPLVARSSRAWAPAVSATAPSEAAAAATRDGATTGVGGDNAARDGGATRRRATTLSRSSTSPAAGARARWLRGGRGRRPRGGVVRSVFVVVIVVPAVPVGALPPGSTPRCPRRRRRGEGRRRPPGTPLREGGGGQGFDGRGRRRTATAPRAQRVERPVPTHPPLGRSHFTGSRPLPERGVGPQLLHRHLQRPPRCLRVLHLQEFMFPESEKNSWPPASPLFRLHR